MRRILICMILVFVNFPAAAQIAPVSILERLSRLEERIAEQDRWLQKHDQAIRGAVLVSLKPCTTLGRGWRKHVGASGKFLLGVSNDYATGSTGGAKTVTLKIDHMPNHGHPVGPFEVGHTVGGNNHDFRIDADDGEPWNGETHKLKALKVGGGKPHENMPPYLTVHFCEYVE